MGLVSMGSIRNSPGLTKRPLTSNVLPFSLASRRILPVGSSLDKIFESPAAGNRAGPLPACCSRP